MEKVPEGWQHRKGYHDMGTAAIVDQALTEAGREYVIIQDAETGVWNLYMPYDDLKDDD